MSTQSNRETAKIFEFPAGGRTGHNRTPRQAAKPPPAPTTVRYARAACGESWYHEAAVREAELPLER
jgi:hypothetical protein